MVVRGGSIEAVSYTHLDVYKRQILDFKSLYSKLVKDYRVVVVEKFGYGFSDDWSKHRDLDTILSQTRKALQKADVKGPYVLLPHSMSGLEAMHWSASYPKEVEAIIGLDMSLPQAYDKYRPCLLYTSSVARPMSC